jgi:hypothetical protein
MSKNGYNDEAVAEFDRWLANHDANVAKAERDRLHHDLKNQDRINDKDLGVIPTPPDVPAELVAQYENDLELWAGMVNSWGVEMTWRDVQSYKRGWIDGLKHTGSETGQR